MQDGSEYDDVPVRIDRLRITVPLGIAKHLEPILPELDRLGVLRSVEELDRAATAAATAIEADRRARVTARTPRAVIAGIRRWAASAEKMRPKMDPEGATLVWLAHVQTLLDAFDDSLLLQGRLAVVVEEALHAQEQHDGELGSDWLDLARTALDEWHAQTGQKGT